MPDASGKPAAATAVAEIDVLTPGDRWLTWAFKRSEPSVDFVQPLPPLAHDE